MEESQKNELKQVVNAYLQVLHRTLPIGGWEPCFGQNGCFKSAFERALYNEDMVGKTVVVLRFEHDSKVGFFPTVKVVKITHLDLHAKINTEGVPFLELCACVQLNGETHDVTSQGEIRLNGVRVVAFERTNTKLPDMIHQRGRAKLPPPSQNYANTSAPHNTKVGALSCQNK